MPTTNDGAIAPAGAVASEMALEELKRRLDAKEPFVLLDVREEHEWAAGFIPGAISIPRGRLEREIAGLVPDRETSIVTYCAAGSRARLAAESLASLGYTHVAVATPGFARWNELGYRTEAPPSPLSSAQRERYARHLLLPEVGAAGQARLLASKVLLVGAGGLGSPAALYLAAAGVGTIGLVDADRVDASNLQRQVLHATSRVGQPKVASAAEALADLNPDARVIGHEERLTRDNVERLFGSYDVVVDGSDNFPTRYLVNDASVWLGKPVVHGSISRFDGQLTTLVPEKAARTLGIAPGPCYRCLYPEPPPAHLAPSCQEAGVLGVLPGVIGMLQATEALKLLLGIGEPLVGRVVTYDALTMRFRELRLRRDARCAVCGPAPTITSYVDYDALCSRA